MSTDSFHSICSHHSETATDEDSLLVMGSSGSSLRILGSSVETWCPERYRVLTLDWLNGQDERTRTAFDLYIGAATNYDDHLLLKSLVEGNLDRLGLRREYFSVRTRLRSPVNGASINTLRLAAAFPDRTLAFRSIFCAGATVTLSLFKRASHFTMPALLTFPQAVHLDLDHEMQGYADQYNRHFWLSINEKDSEVPGCGHFVYKYFVLARDNKVPLFFRPGMFVKDAKAVSHRLFKPPYNYEQLVAYLRLMGKFTASQDRLGIEDIKAAFEKIDRSELTPLSTIESIFEDERRDGAVPRLQSTSLEYREAKAAVWEAREKQAQEREAKKQAREKRAKARAAQREAREKQAREKDARKREAREAGIIQGESRKARKARETKEKDQEVSRMLNDLFSRMGEPVEPVEPAETHEDRYEPPWASW